MDLAPKLPELRRSFAESLQHLREAVYVPPEVRTPFDDGPKVTDKETFGAAFLEATVGEEVDLSQLTLPKTCLAFCDIRANFAHSTLANSRFYESLFHGASFEGATFTNFRRPLQASAPPNLPSLSITIHLTRLTPHSRTTLTQANRR